MTSRRLASQPAGQALLSNVRIWGEELQAPVNIRRGLRRLYREKLDSLDHMRVRAEGRGSALGFIATSFSSWIRVEKPLRVSTPEPSGLKPGLIGVLICFHDLKVVAMSLTRQCY